MKIPTKLIPFRSLRLFISKLRRKYKRLRHLIDVRTSYAVNVIRTISIINIVKTHKPGTPFIVIGLTEHFGDIVASEPISRHIRKTYPDAFIIWCVRKPYTELVENNPHIDKVLVVECLTEWIYLSQRKRFDIVFDLHMNRRVCHICQIPLIKTNGTTDITVENYYTYGNLLAAFSQSAGLPALDLSPQVYISAAQIEKVNRLALPDDYIVVHCSSNEVARDWQPAKWQELVKRLVQTTTINIVEVGAKPLLNDIFPSRYTDLCGQLSFLETAEVIRRARLFIGVDSGPAHLANAVGTTGIILLGRYRAFERYLPYSGRYANGEKAHLLYADGPASELPEEHVWSVVAQELSRDQHEDNATSDSSTGD